MPLYSFLGVDLGQMNDFTALSVLQTQERPRHPRWLVYGVDSEPPGPAHRSYDLRYLERVALGTPYPAVVDQVQAMREHLARAGEVSVVVDATGVGAPVVDLFEREGVPVIPVSITGGDTVGERTGGGFTVPKRDLVTNLQALFQMQQLRIAEGLALADTFVKELANFRLKLNLVTGHDRFEALREGEHDDLVLSVALAGWYAER